MTRQNAKDTVEGSAEKAKSAEAAAATAKKATAEKAESVAATALHEGAEAGSKAANKFIPALGNIVSKSLYSGCYAVSFGVTFGVVAVAKALPLNNVVGRGFQDGAHDAIERLEHHPETTVEVPTEASATA